jgi:hypothetical protein
MTAKPRHYSGPSGFSFRSAGCSLWIPVGFDRLESKPGFECYQCGAQIPVPNPRERARLGRQADAALQALHEEMDASPVLQGVEFLGEQCSR